MLEHLYGLLEVADAQALQGHVQECAVCRSALARADEQQKLIASAARTEVAGFRFEVPADDAPASTVPYVARIGRSSRVRRWAVAACVWLALGALGLAGATWYHRAHQLEQAVTVAKADRDERIEAERKLTSTHVASLNRAHDELNDAAKKTAELEVKQQQKLTQAEKELREKEMSMVVSGPQRIPAGAATEYRIETSNLNQEPVPTQLDTRVVDQTSRQVLFEAKDIASNGKYRLVLPPTLQVRPNSQLALEVYARAQGGREVQVREELSLGKPVYVTQLSTDKPMYQPGETVFFRSLTLERFSLKPPSDDLQLVFTVTDPSQQVVYQQKGLARLRDAQNHPVNGPDNQPIRGIGAGQLRLPTQIPGGEYTLAVSEAHDRFPRQERKFIVHRYQKHRLHKELEFTRKTYGPGDDVLAACKVTLAQGSPVTLTQPAVATVRIDGKQYDRDGHEVTDPASGKGNIVQPVDPDGGVPIRFTLPAQIERGEASLAVTFNDASGPETIVRPIPIVLKKLDVEFFPEGGDLVANVPNRVYFQVRTLLGKPADLQGRVVDPAGKVVAEIKTLTDDHQPGVNQGMGTFEFTPTAGTVYELKIDSPVGIESKHFLPNVTDDGVALRIPTGLTGDTEPIRVLVTSTKRDRQLLVGAYCRGRLLDHRRVTARADEPTEVLLKPDSGVGGVYRVTVFEEQAGADNRQELAPKAERLIYRLAAGRLSLAMKPNRTEYSPRDQASVQLAATNEKGQPTPAILLVAVVDKTVLNMADEKTARSMPTHFFLTSEVRRPEDLEHADFLLSDHPLAPIALDLLLGTQGWRRFAEQDPRNFQKEYKQDAERLLVSLGQMAPAAEQQKRLDPLQQEKKKVLDEYQPQVEQLQERLAEAQDQLAVAEEDREYVTQKAQLAEDVRGAELSYLAALQQQTDFQDRVRDIRRGVLAGLAMLLLAIALGSVAIGLARSGIHGRRYLVAGATALALCVMALTGVLIDHQGRRVEFEKVARVEERAATPGLESAKQQPLQPEPSGEPTAGTPTTPTNASGAAPRPDAADRPTDRSVAPLAPAAPPVARPTPAPVLRSESRRDGAGGKPGQNAALADKAEAARKEGKDLDALKRGTKQLNLLTEDSYRRAADGKEADGAYFFRSARGGDAMPDMERQQLAKRQLWQNADEQAKNLYGRGAVAKGAAAPMQPSRAAGLGGLQLNRGYNPPPPPFVVREYAHQRVPGASPGERRDFTETLYWHPVVILPNGEGQVSFQLNDSTTSFQVAVAGHTTDGRLGAATAVLESRLPFSVDPKLPIEVTRTDKLDIPVAIANDTDSQRTVQVQVEAKNLALKAGTAPAERLTLGPNQRARRTFRFQPTIIDGDADLVFKGRSEPFATDEIRRSVKVVPDGFPVVGSASDLLEKAAQHRIELPNAWVEGSLKCTASVYPSTLADLQQSLESMLREPCGCFEQTSSSNYPNLLVLDYLQTNGQARPEIARRANELLDRGYHRLITFECQNPDNPKQREGFEWFGGTVPPHEALTAYGLMEFRDMARVYNVDPALIERTRKFLMGRKDGHGGFLRKKDGHQFGNVPDQIYNAYIVWALTESSPNDDVQKELAALAAQARTSNDPYFLALVANSLLNRNQEAPAVELLRKLTKLQKLPAGVVDGAQTSITVSSGRDLQIETTALTLLAWLKHNRPEFIKNAQAAVRWIGQQRGGYGGYGSTQSTVLALKALIAYTRHNQQQSEPGELTLYVGGKKAKSISFKAGASDVLTLALDKPEELLKPGANDVRLEITGKNLFPYTLTWSYAAVTPTSAAKCPVQLSTRLGRASAAEEERVALTATVTNTSGKDQGMALAIIGLPGGLSLPEKMDQLKDYVKEGRISYWELRGRELILYWRGLAKDQQVEVNLDLICRVPGEYRGPASRAYLYYNADHKHWVEPLAIEIAAKVD
jgi:hypothetical protein